MRERGPAGAVLQLRIQVYTTVDELDLFDERIIKAIKTGIA